MRLLKARGKMSHADLVTELPSTLPRGCLNGDTTATGSGSAPEGPLIEPELLSRCVEYLLDKEYIEVEGGDDVVYVYVP